MSSQRHRTKIEVANHWWVWKKYRAFCSHCDWRSPWRGQETSALADAWYHDDQTFFELINKTSTDKS